MSNLRDRFAGIRRQFHLPDVARDVREELAFHFESTVEELLAQGLSETQAREEAERRFGDQRFYRRELERIDRRMSALRRLRERFGALGFDLRYACRRLARSPGLSLGIVLTLALGIGANATMFGVVDRLLLRPPAHLVEPDSIVRIGVEREMRVGQARRTSDWLTFPDFRDLEAAESFTAVAAHSRQNLIVGRGAEARPVAATLVSGAYFPMLGVQPESGRLLGPADDRQGAAAVAVLGHGFWQRAFESDPGAIGRTVDFGHGPYEIVGVAPEAFTGVDLDPIDLWLPFQVAGEDLRGARWRQARNWYWLSAIARLAPGVDAERAEAEATALHLAGRSEQIGAEKYDPEARVKALPLIAGRGPLASNESKVARWLAGVSLVVLLIACANVANLLLARSLRQRREHAIRLALGISRRSLMGQVLIESAVLAIFGGAVALLFTHWTGRFLRVVLLPDVEWTDPPVAARVALLSFALCLVAGLLAGILPALQASRPGVVESLKAGSRTVSSPGSGARNSLTVFQAALSVVLLAGAGLFLRSLHRVESLDLGFEPEGLLLIEPIYQGEPTAEQRSELYRRAVERVPRLPAVETAAESFGLPFWSAMSADLTIPGVETIPELPAGEPVIHAVGAEYFSSMRLRITRGRGFTAADRDDSQLVAVVGETMARLVWPGSQAIGQCLQIGDQDCAEVIGVVEDAKLMSLREGEVMQYYVPFAQSPYDQPPEAMLARIAGAVDRERLGTTISAIRRELLALDPDLRFVELRHYPDIIDPQARSWRLGAMMFSLFGGLALVVAAVGLYSVLAFAVAQRTHEMGIRSALGAARGQIAALILGHSLRLIGFGVAIGLLVVLVAAPEVEPLLFETSPRDPWTLSAIAAAVFLTALAAAGWPARQASRVDPSVALRAE